MATNKSIKKIMNLKNQLKEAQLDINKAKKKMINNGFELTDIRYYNEKVAAHSFINSKIKKEKKGKTRIFMNNFKAPKIYID